MFFFARAVVSVSQKGLERKGTSEEEEEEEEETQLIVDRLKTFKRNDDYMSYKNRERESLFLCIFIVS